MSQSTLRQLFTHLTPATGLFFKVSSQDVTFTLTMESGFMVVYFFVFTKLSWLQRPH